MGGGREIQLEENRVGTWARRIRGGRPVGCCDARAGGDDSEGSEGGCKEDVGQKDRQEDHLRQAYEQPQDAGQGQTCGQEVEQEAAQTGAQARDGAVSGRRPTC